MTTPGSYLFAIIDGGGTVPADTSVIRAMVERGHDVRVLADRVLAPDIEATGAEHVPWNRAPQRPNLDPLSMVVNDYDAKTPFQAFALIRDGVIVGPADRFAADVRDELRRRPADVVVGNFFVFGAQIAAEAEGVPFAFLVSNLLSFKGSGTPPLGPGLKPARGPLGRARDAGLNRLMARLFDKGLDRLNEVRSANGVAPVASVLESFERADRLLLMTSRAFEYETFSPPPNVRLVGPAPRRPGLGRRVDPARGRRSARARRDELHVHGPRRRAAARDDRARRPARARARDHRSGGPGRRDRRARERDRRRAGAAQPGAPPRVGGRDARGTRHGDQVARGRRARRGDPAGARPARQRRPRGAPRGGPAAEAESVERRDRASREASVGRAVLPGERRAAGGGDRLRDEPGPGSARSWRSSRSTRGARLRRRSDCYSRPLP